VSVFLVKAVALVLLLIGSYAILEALVRLDSPKRSRRSRSAYR
jgi:hypothetical protein